MLVRVAGRRRSMRCRTSIALALGAVTLATAAIAEQAHEEFVLAESHTPVSAVVDITPAADTWFEVDVGTGAPVNPTPQGGDEVPSSGVEAALARSLRVGL